MFQRALPPTSTTRRNVPAGGTHRPPERLHALSVLLSANRYTQQGLCVLAHGGGFVVAGFIVPEHSAPYSLACQSMEIGEPVVALTLERLREESAGAAGLTKQSGREVLEPPATVSR